MINAKDMNKAVLDAKNSENKEMELLRISIYAKAYRENNSEYDKLIQVTEFNKLSKDLLKKNGQFTKWFMDVIKDDLIEAHRFEVTETTMVGRSYH